MKIKKEDAHKYIRPGAQIRRAYNTNHGSIVVTNMIVKSHIYVSDNKGLLAFDVERIHPERAQKEYDKLKHWNKVEHYYLNDCFNGSVTLVKASINLEDELFEI